MKPAVVSAIPTCLRTIIESSIDHHLVSVMFISQLSRRQRDGALAERGLARKAHANQRPRARTTDDRDVAVERARAFEQRPHADRRGPRGPRSAAVVENPSTNSAASSSAASRHGTLSRCARSRTASQSMPRPSSSISMTRRSSASRDRSVSVPLAGLPARSADGLDAVIDRVAHAVDERAPERRPALRLETDAVILDARRRRSACRAARRCAGPARRSDAAAARWARA